jgi:hypothetical protein
MTETKDQTETFEADFPNGVDETGDTIYRTIVFRQPSEGQIAVIARGVRKAQRGGGRNTLEAIGLILDVIDRLVVEEDDRGWLEDGLSDASLSLNDFIAVIEGLNAPEEEPEEKPAKKLANAARARTNGRR